MVTVVVAMETVEAAMVIAGTEVVDVATTEVALSVVSPADLAANRQKKMNLTDWGKKSIHNE